MSQGRHFRTDDSRSKVTKDCFYAYDPSSFALTQDYLIVQYGTGAPAIHVYITSKK